MPTFAQRSSSAPQPIISNKASMNGAKIGQGFSGRFLQAGLTPTPKYMPHFLLASSSPLPVYFVSFVFPCLFLSQSLARFGETQTCRANSRHNLTDHPINKQTLHPRMVSGTAVKSCAIPSLSFGEARGWIAAAKSNTFTQQTCQP